MNYRCTCPICNNKAARTAYSSEWGLEEEHIDCKRCGYYYEFAYGYYIEAVKGKEFYWSYTTKQSAPVFNRMQRAEFMARRNWKKWKKGYAAAKKHMK